MHGREKLAAVIVTMVAIGGCGTAEEVAESSSALVGFPDQIGVFRNGGWLLDKNSNNVWDGTPTDVMGLFGSAGDKPLVSTIPCNPYAGTKQIFVLRGNYDYFWTFNDLDWSGGDQSFVFGHGFDGEAFPVMLAGHLASVSEGYWEWDVDDDHQYTSNDIGFRYGAQGDTAVAGGWGPGRASVPGVYRDGRWTVDSNNNHIVDGSDARFTFGGVGFLPVVGDFNLNHAGTEVGAFRDGTWLIDFNGNFRWDGPSGGDKIYTFGAAGDIPVVAHSRWTVDGCVG